MAIVSRTGLATALLCTLLACTQDKPNSSARSGNASAAKAAADEAAKAESVAEHTPKFDVAGGATGVADGSPLTVDFLRKHIVALSDDAMEGRGPGTPGGEKAVAYIVAQMKALGLQPAGANGSYTQKVPMRAVRLDRDKASLSLRGADGTLTPLGFGTEIVAGRLGPAATTKFDTPLVFVGYGVTAPEYDWDDYKNVDVRGKIAVVFVGDPPTPDDRFGGRAMTYYGRWTYKYERALEAGAAGCLIVHETAPASYGWNVVESSWSGERFSLADAEGKNLGLQGWIHRDLAERLAVAQGQTLEQWHTQALTPGFEAVELDTDLVAELTTVERTLSDANVLGLIPGRTLPDEFVLLTAHWDHLGIDEDAEPGTDAIFNGAVDNASGIAAILGVAAGLKAREKEGRGPARSVVLLATTAEEQGLLGSRYYAQNPVVEASTIAGVVNLDSMNVYGPTTTVTVPGLGHTTLEDDLRLVAEAQGRKVVGDARPEAGSFYRSDHFSFAKRGIPAITFGGGKTYVGATKEEMEEIKRTMAEHYHTVDDQYDPSWPLTGALQDTEAALALVARVCDAAQRPTWKPTSELAPRP